jgi:hypothetical protein
MAPKEIYYSDKYNDDKFEYRHVMLPKDIAKLVPKTHLVSNLIELRTPFDNALRQNHLVPRCRVVAQKRGTMYTGTTSFDLDYEPQNLNSLLAQERGSSLESWISLGYLMCLKSALSPARLIDVN